MSAAASNYLAWTEKAEHDLLNIENNLTAERVPWDTVCFHAQQAGEKYLKAFLVYHGLTPPYIHELLPLLAQCRNTDPDLGVSEEDCRNLSRYAVAARYPEDLYGSTRDDALPLVEAAHRVRAAVLARLPQTP